MEVEHLLAAIKPWLQSQRWFLAKSRSSFELTLAANLSFEVDGRLVPWWILRVTCDHKEQLYQLPLACLEDVTTVSPGSVMARVEEWDGWLVDAWGWPVFGAAVLKLMGSPLAPEASALQYWHDTPLESIAADAVRLPTHEQSNSVVCYGDRYFLKAFRVVTPGLHPEVEIGRYLTQHGFPNSIPVRGMVSWHEQSQSAALAVLYDYLPNQGSAWSWFLTASPEPMGDQARQLGSCTAGFHRTLAAATDDPAFVAEPYRPQNLAAFQQRLVDRMTELFSRLAERAGIATGVQKHVVTILQQQASIRNWITSWRPSGSLGLRTRIHGDYHLGQVLVGGDRLYITDFEGEPLRSLTERRQKDTPLRDVAGMRRSFDYAAAVARRQKTAMTANSNNYEEMKCDFTAAYFATAAQCPGLLPAEDADRQTLLQLYELEKTLYEVDYELRARPEWLSIPLGALYDLFRAIGESNAS